MQSPQSLGSPKPRGVAAAHRVARAHEVAAVHGITEASGSAAAQRVAAAQGAVAAHGTAAANGQPADLPQLRGDPIPPRSEVELFTDQLRTDRHTDRRYIGSRGKSVRARADSAFCRGPAVAPTMPEEKKAVTAGKKKVAKKAAKKTPSRLYAKGTILGYKRSKSNCYATCTLVQIDGVRTKEDAEWYFGKRIAYIYRAKKETKR